MPSKYRLIGPVWASNIGAAILKAATQETLEYGRNVIAGLTPVKSGQLRDGWKASKEAIYNDVPYTRWVDEGTSRMTARAMTARSIPLIEIHYEEAIARQVRRLN